MSVSLDELGQALEDIKEWFVDQGAHQIVENLNEGVSRAELERVCGVLSVEPLAELAWLYAKHNGQPDVERYPLFGWLTFLSLAWVEQAFDDLLYCYFGRSGRWDEVNPSAIYDGGHLSDQEKNAKWFPFANHGFDFFAVHTQTGRVIRVLKGDFPPIAVVADSMGEFVMQYASDLWDDLYVIGGDLEHAGVVQEGFVSLGAYAELSD